MEAMRAMAQQPPQRIDSDTQSHSLANTEHKEESRHMNANNNKDNIPDVDICLAYKRKSLKHRVECGVGVKIGKEEVEELKLLLGSRKCQMYKHDDSMSSCVVCDEQCIDGKFAVETVLFIPNKNDPAYDNLGRFRIELPRIACHECAAEYASMNAIHVITNNIQLSLAKVWQNYQSGELNLNVKSGGSAEDLVSPGALHQDENKFSSPKPVPPQQVQPHARAAQQVQSAATSMNESTASQSQSQSQSQAQKQTMPLSEAERDPFDDGFLICTQLVKTGGADQGGLQVGDVFVEFGHYCKKRFPGLKSIANLVRRSAGKEINVVVWRKLEQMNAVEDDGTGRTVFQKLALKLKPLQSHDADGGGVLGAVINTYPLPEMKN
eukprot:CAMPEP_0197074022 /NCGR_PEP_ID=MMETSP1384-20130603/210900_1 /TAXON_ID=29189 /ORGANISM="Ammonia sp." /LENGTH=379 /DNA_ID=CAMNT_0042512863 /DNA_START=125 /DNA_END=1264 /DNA_ORIENTATION=-